MIGDMVGQIADMFVSLGRPVLPFALGLVLLGGFLLAVCALWWARPRSEPDPLPLIDRNASDWLGQP